MGANEGIESGHLVGGVKGGITCFPIPVKEGDGRLDYAVERNVRLEPSAVFFLPFKDDGRETDCRMCVGCGGAFHIVGPHSWRQGMFARGRNNARGLCLQGEGFCAVLGNDMANTPVLSDEQWEALRLLSIKGISDNELAERFSVDPATIRQKRFRDEVWKAAWEGIRGKNNELSQKEPEREDSASLAQKVASTVSENIARLGEQNRLLALQIAGKGLKQANDAPPEVQSWQDVKALMDIVSKAAGLEAGNAVQVNILNDSACSVEHGDFPVFEAE